MSATEPTLKALHNTVERSYRCVRKVTNEVLTETSAATPDQINLATNIELLQGETSHLDTLLTQFEQLASDLDDETYKDDQQKWEDAVFEGKRSAARGQKVLDQLNPGVSSVSQQPVSPDTDQGHSGQSNLDQNFARLLTLLETQQQNGSGQLTPGSGPADHTTGNTKLPRLELPKFHGDILKWKPFWDSFEASVDKNVKLAEVDKLNYFLAQLSGDPKRMVGGLSVTNENYTVAKQMLMTKYGDSKLVISMLYRKLNELGKVKNEYRSIQRFVTELDCLLGSLKAHGKDTSDDNFTTVILSKLPSTVVMQLELTKNINDPWTVTLLREELFNYLVRSERASKICGDKCDPPVSGGWDSTGDGFHAGERRAGQGRRTPYQGRSDRPGKYDRNQNTDNKTGCVYCSGEHWSDQCKKYPTADARYCQLKDRCVNCLKTGHMKRDCKSTKPCYYCQRVGNHHSSLCFNKFGRRKIEDGHVAHEPDTGSQNGDQSPNMPRPDKESMLLAAGEDVMLQTAMIPAGKPGHVHGFRSTRALLDPGANRSYCSEKFAKSLGLSVKPGPTLLINRFASDRPVSVNTKTTKLDVKRLDGSMVTIEVCVIPQITGGLTRSKVESQKLQKLKLMVKLADSVPEQTEYSPIEFLIGSDYYLDFITGDKIEVGNGLYLLGSEFGYILSGRLPVPRSKNEAMSMLSFDNLRGETTVAQDGAEQYGDWEFRSSPQSDLFSLEALGIRDDPSYDETDYAAMRSFADSVTFQNGRYSVSLPFNDKKSELDSHYQLCEGRLKSLTKRLHEKKDLADQYNKIIEDQESKGVVEKVQTSDPDTIKGQVHYIPHHAVVTPQKETTKVRIVYDGSAKVRKVSPSLNECLYRGPVLLENLAGLLLRFRLNPVAIVADIEKAFLQIGINEEDRDMVRFLWLKDPERHADADNVQIYRFCRVLFGLNCSPTLLAETILYHLTTVGGDIAEQIKGDLYVDNVITGTETTDEANIFYDKAKRIFDDASMNLREWASNSKEFMNYVKPVDRVKGRTMKVLGVKWEMGSDTLTIGVPKRCPDGIPITKRQLLSEVSAVYDPLGWFSPCVVRSKAILQEVVKKKTKWDEEITDDLKMTWLKERQSLIDLEKVPLPRLVNATSTTEVCVFCDASKLCFAAAVYLRTECRGSVFTNLVMSKTRLNPVKPLTIPKAELMAIVIGVRLMTFVQKQLKIPVHQMTLFSDSKCALSWLNSEKNIDVFTRNRVREICIKAPNVVCRFVPTDQNPADWATRGKSPTELTDFWWHGPPWLSQNPPQYPVSDMVPFTPKVNCVKMKVAHEAGLTANESNISPLAIDPHRYSAWNKLKRVTAWCLRFVNRLRGKALSDFQTDGLSSTELANAGLLWVAWVQQEKYSEVIMDIKEGRKHRMSNLGLFLDSNVLLRCAGRMENAELPYAAKYPVLLPSEHYVTQLLISNVHQKCGHSGAAQTLNTLRQEFWVPKGRALVKRIIGRCVICKKATGATYPLPPMPELPRSRVATASTFDACGVDYFGPVKLKGKLATEKAWVCLFTCFTTRAVHLELVEDLSAKSFLLALRRFISRRGVPTTMISDNAPQFKLVADVIKDAWLGIVKSPDVIDYSSEHGITWSFITEYAPYMGGVYERMVGVVKGCLRKTVGKALLTAPQFETLLCECESLVNTRPLTYVHSEPQEVKVLTPAHFMNPSGLTVSPRLPEEFKEIHGATRSELEESWLKGQHVISEFWSLWSVDYLNMLRERNTYLHKHSSRSKVKPKVDHLVLLKDNILPRGSWKIGRIISLDESADGQVRGAKVRLPTGVVLHRPVGLLIPFETESSEEDRNHSESADTTAKETEKDSRVSRGTDNGQPVQVVFAKIRGYPKWPAEVLTDISDTPLANLRAPKSSVAVKFFRTEKYAFVNKGKISEFTKNEVPTTKNPKLKEAVKMAEEIVGNLD